MIPTTLTGKSDLDAWLQETKNVVYCAGGGRITDIGIWLVVARYQELQRLRKEKDNE